MKAYKLEVLVIDFENIGSHGVSMQIENMKGLHAKVKAFSAQDIGDWSDDHPLNHGSTQNAEYFKLFKYDNGFFIGDKNAN